MPGWLWGAVDCVFLTTLRAVIETVLHYAANFQELRERTKPLEARVLTLEETTSRWQPYVDLMQESRITVALSPIVANDSEEGEEEPSALRLAQ